MLPQVYFILYRELAKSLKWRVGATSVGHVVHLLMVLGRKGLGLRVQSWCRVLLLSLNINMNKYETRKGLF